MKKNVIFFVVMYALTHTMMAQTVMLFEKGKQYRDQVWFSGYELPASQIDSNLKIGLRITSVGYTGMGFTFAMSRGTGYGRQTYIQSQSYKWPKEWVRQQLNDTRHKMAISSLAFCGRWVVVCSEGTGYTNQKIQEFENEYKLSAWLKDAVQSGRYITSVCFGNHKWRVVSSENATYLSQNVLIVFSSNELKKELKKKVWDKGLRVHHISFGDGRYLVVYGEYSKSSGRWQKLQSVDNYSSYEVKKMLEKQLDGVCAIAIVCNYSLQQRKSHLEQPNKDANHNNRFQYDPNAHPVYPIYSTPSASQQPNAPSYSPEKTEKKHGMRECPCCNGRGYVYDSKEYGPQYTGNPQKIWCETCHYYDYRHYHKRPICRVCNGKGKVVNLYD